MTRKFEPSPSARARASGGSGSGLAIALAIVAAHGGRIHVESDGPGGAALASS